MPSVGPTQRSHPRHRDAVSTDFAPPGWTRRRGGLPYIKASEEHGGEHKRRARGNGCTRDRSRVTFRPPCNCQRQRALHGHSRARPTAPHRRTFLKVQHGRADEQRHGLQRPRGQDHHEHKRDVAAKTGEWQPLPKPAPCTASVPTPMDVPSAWCEWGALVGQASHQIANGDADERQDGKDTHLGEALGQKVGAQSVGPREPLFGDDGALKRNCDAGGDPRPTAAATPVPKGRSGDNTNHRRQRSVRSPRGVCAAGCPVRPGPYMSRPK